jgi:protein-disulfide isomerase
MNIKRIVFWSSFGVILGLIIWVLSVVKEKENSQGGIAGKVPPISSVDHVRGPDDAKVTIIEYSDFQCPACQTYFWFLDRLHKEASTTVRFAYRQYPLPQHANAMPSAMATEAAGVQGKFWEMYDLVFANHADWEEQTDSLPVFIGYAEKLGLNKAKFMADMSNQDLKDKILEDLKGGQIAGVNATPTFFINGKRIDNPRTYADFKKLIDEAASSNTN